MRTILLIEDDPDIRHMVSYKLTKGGFAIIEAPDGAAGLSAARQQRPDLVLVDLQMPRMSGLEVCRELRAAAATADVPIIMFTARSAAADIEEAYAAGATDYVVKPFSPRELQERVESALSAVGS